MEHMRQTQKSLPIALLRAREAVMAHFRPMLAAHDLNEQQWRVIRVLDENSELDATELATKALVLGPSLTRMIKTLLARKLVVSSRDRKDGRRTLLRLTPKARLIIDEIAPESASIYQTINGKLGTANNDRLLDLLELVIQRLAD